MLNLPAFTNKHKYIHPDYYFRLFILFFIICGLFVYKNYYQKTNSDTKAQRIINLCKNKKIIHKNTDISIQKDNGILHVRHPEYHFYFDLKDTNPDIYPRFLEHSEEQITLPDPYYSLIFTYKRDNMENNPELRISFALFPDYCNLEKEWSTSVPAIYQNKEIIKIIGDKLWYIYPSNYHGICEIRVFTHTQGYHIEFSQVDTSSSCKDSEISKELEQALVTFDLGDNVENIWKNSLD